MLAGCGSAVQPAEPDADIETDAAPRADASPALPTVAEAFDDCTAPGPAGGLANGTELMRVDIDTSVFPDAVCNDGTGAVIYVRRAARAEHEARWVIQLQGGGGCQSAESCAERWCAVDTNLGARKMSNRFAPETGIRGNGILANRVDNPFAGWNQVLVYHCASDSWSGRAGAVTLEAPHPEQGGDPVSYRIYFNGGRIVEAVVDSLRRDGVASVGYTDASGNPQQLPDLDDATTVVLSGASAGGGGVLKNLDWMADRLRATNTSCASSTCDLEVMGIIDSSYSVDFNSLDFSPTPLCTEMGLCSADAYQSWRYYEVGVALWNGRVDESCVAWHEDGNTGMTHWCSNNQFVAENHITTPFVVRMGLTDENASSKQVAMGFGVPSRGGANLTLPIFAELVAEQLTTLPADVASGLESSAVTKLPGAFGPPCSKHETLSNNTHYYDTTVAGLSFPQLLTNWYQGSGTTVAVATMGDGSTCP